MAFLHAKCFERILDELPLASAASTSCQARAVAPFYNRVCTIIVRTKGCKVFPIHSRLRYVTLGADFPSYMEQIDCRSFVVSSIPHGRVLRL